jgi:hypothetical protein
VAVLAQQMHLVSQSCEGLREACGVDVRAGALEQIAVEHQDPHPGQRSRRSGGSARVPPVSSPQRYRLRNPASGRDVIVEAEPDLVYRDQDTGEPLEVVGKVLPLAPSASRLPWAVENLRFCPCCGHMAQKDLNDCPTCGRRMGPLGPPRRGTS